jgi:hypothetical protein
VLINFSSSGNIIGGVDGGQNVISANVSGGVVVSVGSANNVILGNLIGTSADGAISVANNLYGIVLGAAGGGNIIGGDTSPAGNRISGGGGDGVRIENGTTLAVVQGNAIGIRADGVPYGDTGYGVRIEAASGNTIGGFGQFEGNVIANDRIGVAVIGNASTGNRIVRNTFISGVDTPIDLGDDEDDDNDSGDTDSGPNERQNYPVITGANVIGADLGVVGTLDTLPGSYTVQLYRSSTTSDFGHGDGTPFATFPLVVGGGVATFARSITGAGVSIGENISAIVVNDATGDTSEFSLVFAAVPAVPAQADKKHPFTFTDANGDRVKVVLTGKGTVNVTLRGGVADNEDIALLELLGTDLASRLTVAVISKNSNGTTISRIATTDPLQHLGSIKLGPKVTFGDGVADAVPDVLVTGRMKALLLDDLAPNTIIELGGGLPYDLAGRKASDSLNNRPALTIGDVLGAGVQINVLNDGVPGLQGGVGGGGFGNVVIRSWEFPGFIRTTQSIGNFTVKTGDFYGVLEVDKFMHGEGTQADVGRMTIADGAWGSSGSEIEGYVSAFNAEAFLAGASIMAGNIGSIKMTAPTGGFQGTLILTDPDAPALPTFTVNSNFSGRVVSANSIKKLSIKGDFTGSLEAPSIGAITAFRFLGTAGDTDITATLGGIGLLKSTAGVFRDYEVVTPAAFSGINVRLSKLTEDAIGVDNVHVTAASVGNIAVSLAASRTSTGVDLTGIRNSDFTTTGTGATSKTSGRIGNISVTLTGGAGGNATGISDATFDAIVPGSTVNTLGNISVRVSGFGGQSIGVEGARFEGDTIGGVKVSVTRGKTGGATGFGVNDLTLISSRTISSMNFDGDVSGTQVTALTAVAGGSIGKVGIKSKTAALGTLDGSTLLAGQALSLAGTDKQLKSALAGAALGPVTASGSITGSVIAAGATVRGLTAGGEMSDTLVLAGAMLGANRALGGGDDTFQRAASIAAITVKGAFARSSIAAGINPGNGVFGDADDTLAAAAGTLNTTGSIGAITLALASGPQPAAAPHSHAIEAASLKSLRTIAGIIKNFTDPAYLDVVGPGEDSDDILVRVL